MDIRKWQGDRMTIQVDYDKCNGDGACVYACPAEVYELKNGKSAATYTSDCIGCCACLEVCTEEAIDLSSSENP